MARLTVAAAARAVAGRVIGGDPEALVKGAAIDSRRLRAGELFFAFAGQQTDGHLFVADAFVRGAAAAVVERSHGPFSPPPLGSLIEVESSFKALHDLARSVRERLPRHLLAVTGSAGKTTTKELLAAMLASRFRVTRTPGNLNNAFGFPLSLLNLPEESEWMVAEMGMSAPGELRELSLLGRPDVALFTVVRPVHLEFFRDLREIAEAKAELLAGLAPDGLIVANADDPEVLRIAQRGALPSPPPDTGAFPGLRPDAGALPSPPPGAGVLPGSPPDAGALPSPPPDAGVLPGSPPEAGALPGPPPEAGAGAGAARGRRLVLYSSHDHPEAAVRARDIAALPEGQIGTRFTLQAAGESVEVVLPLHGRYNAENCLAAAAAAWAIGVPLAGIAAAVRDVQPAAMRGVVHRARRGFLLVDDSYNSNPDSLHRALESAAALPANRRLAVLGEMLELGAGAPRFHREAGEQAAGLGFAIVAGVGELARETAAGARAAGAAQAVWHRDAAAAAEWAADAVRPGDLVLVKGSRRVGLERVVHRLLAEEEA